MKSIQHPTAKNLQTEHKLLLEDLEDIQVMIIHAHSHRSLLPEHNREGIQTFVYPDNQSENITDLENEEVSTSVNLAEVDKLQQVDKNITAVMELPSESSQRKDIRRE